jgi:hypothetical protein
MGDMSGEYAEELENVKLPGIVYRSLRHGAMHYHAEVMDEDEWYDNGPHDRITVSLCIQIAIKKTQLCLLYVAYACPYYSITPRLPWDTVQNVDRLPTQSHTRGLRL